MRLAALYLRSRRFGGTVSTLVFVAFLLWAGTQYSLSQHNRVESGALIPFLVLGALAAACVIGAGAGSPFGEAELTVSRSLPPIRAAHLGSLLLLAVAVLGAALLSFDLPGARPAAPMLMLLRNLAGFGGLALLTACLVGARLSWVLPLVFGIASILSTLNSNGTFPAWAWQMQPGNDELSWVISLALFLAGLALICLLGARDTSDGVD